MVALKLRSLRFHSPRLCRAAVFLIQPNVSLCLSLSFFIFLSVKPRGYGHLPSPIPSLSQRGRFNKIHLLSSIKNTATLRIALGCRCFEIEIVMRRSGIQEEPRLIQIHPRAEMGMVASVGGWFVMVLGLVASRLHSPRIRAESIFTVLMASTATRGPRANGSLPIP